jgi:hypothetical protein
MHGQIEHFHQSSTNCGKRGLGLCKAVVFVYSICFPIELALQHSIHICNTQEHFLGFRLGLVKAFTIYQIDKWSWLTPYKLKSKCS